MSFALTFQTLNAQSKDKLFLSFSGELPTINLSGNNFISQQSNFSFGYTLPNNFELLLNIGAGVFGENSETKKYIYENTNLGIGADYLFPINDRYKLGFEVASSLAWTITNDIDNDHIIYQGGIKLQESNSLFGILGVRYRSFIDNPNNSLELFYGIGIRMDFKKK